MGLFGFFIALGLAGWAEWLTYMSSFHVGGLLTVRPSSIPHMPVSAATFQAPHWTPGLRAQTELIRFPPSWRLHPVKETYIKTE